MYGAEGLSIPQDYTRVVELLTNRNQGYVTFQQLREACLQDTLELNGQTESSELEAEDLEDIEVACISIVRQIAEGGIGRVWANLDDMRSSPAMVDLVERGRRSLEAERALRAGKRRLPVTGQVAK